MLKQTIGVAISIILLVMHPAVMAEDAMRSGEAYVTRFSGVVTENAQSILDINGTVGDIIDIRQPGRPPQGQLWATPPQRLPVTAAQVGQVFGVALDDASPPNIYLTTTSAYGLYRNTDNSDWMSGMWGGGSPGTVWRLSAVNGYTPELFGTIKLKDRSNSGAALGNIAYDRWNKQLYVSDLETGMIHRLNLADGSDLGHYDHGVDGRTKFVDVDSDIAKTLPPIEFNSATKARIDDCAFGKFFETPACWNFADFRRRIWGLAVRKDPATKEVRLYYALWGSQAFGHPDWPAAGGEQRNSVWSVRIGENGTFDTAGVRREFLLPDFFTEAADISRAGASNPVAGIAFPQYGEQNVMVLAERSGIRNLGLGATSEATLIAENESRVLRYRLDDNGVWQPDGRYAVGRIRRGTTPKVNANAGGGVAFGPAYTEEWSVDTGQPNQFLWVTAGNPGGLQGMPVEDVSDQAAEEGLDHSFIIDDRMSGSITIYQPPPPTDVPDDWMPPGWVPDEEWSPVDDWAPPPEWIPPDDWSPDDGWLPPPWWDWPLPPPLLGTDLEIVKAGPAECQEGVNCAYTITVTNRGPLFYAGPLFISDTMPEGASLASASAGWHCDVAGRNVTCRQIGGVALANGGATTLTLTLQLPAEIAADNVENCTAIHWGEMGTRDGPDGNDESCINTPVTEGFDLGLAKDTVPAECRAGGLCLYDITITNHGPGDFTGPLAIRDTLPAGATLTGSGDGWGCSQVGDSVNCQNDNVGLAAAANTHLHLQIRLPAEVAAAEVENCAAIDWTGMEATDGNGDAHPDQACATTPVVNVGFDLEIEKRGPAHCDPGAECRYSITVTNHGPEPYADRLVLKDEYPAGATPVLPMAGALVCPPGGAPNTFTCAFEIAPLPPGGSVDFTSGIELPDPVGADEVTNCIQFQWGHILGMPVDDIPADALSDRNCVTTQISEGFDLEIAKTGPLECFEGDLCEYNITLTNNGPRPYGSRFFSVIDTLPEGATVEGTSAGWSCTPTGVANQIKCHGDTLSMPPPPDAFPKNLTLRLRLADEIVGDTVENCATLDWTALDVATGDDNPGNDGPVCHTTTILAADLAPFSGTICKRGENCVMEVRLENRGGRRFRGKAGLQGTLTPAVAIQSVKALSSGFSCRATNSNSYECLHDSLDLKPGAAARLQLTITIPKTFPHDRIVHRKEMLWPDRQVKDRKPGNDRHQSIITIEGEKPPSVLPTCPQGWNAFPAGSEIPKGWEERRLEENGRVVFCGKETATTQTPTSCSACEQFNTTTRKCERHFECHSGILRDGKCVCPKGTRPKAITCGYACQAITCPRTQHWDGVKCVRCTKGKAWNGKRCVCPEGSSWNGRQCTKKLPVCKKCERPNPKTRQCERYIDCVGGRIRGGKCICPKGTRAKATTCGYDCNPSVPVSCGQCEKRDPRTKQCRPYTECLGGKSRNGKCLCPSGTEAKTSACGHICKKIICSGGRSWNGKSCVCGKGLVWNGKLCVKEKPACSSGRYWNGKKCACRKGLAWNGRQCVKKTPILKSPVKIVCPKGQTLYKGKCIILK